MNNRARGLLIALVLITPATYADVFSSVCLQGDNSAACIAADAPGGSAIAPAPAPENNTSLTSALRNGSAPPIGAKAPAVSVCSDEANAGTYRCGRLPLGEGETNSTTPGPAPAGWTNPDTPPATASQTLNYSGCGCAPNGSAGATCAAGSWKSTYSSCGSGATPTCTGPTPNGATDKFNCCYNSSCVDIFISKSVSCASGYAVSGSSCNLAEGATNGYAKWSSDGKCSMLRAGHNAYQDSKRDPDCALNGGAQSSANNMPQGATRSGTGVTATGSNGNKTSVSTDSTGKATVSETRANSDGKTSTQSDLETALCSDGKPACVSGESQKQINGVGSKTDPNSPPASGSGGGGATEGTLQGVLGTLNAIKSDIEATTGGLGYTHTGEPGHDPIDKSTEIAAAKQALSTQLTQIKTEAADLFASGLEGGAYTCGNPVTIETLDTNVDFCLSDYQDSLATIGAALVFAAYVLAFFIILG